MAAGIGVLAGSAVSQFASAKQLNYVAGAGFIGIGIWDAHQGLIAEAQPPPQP